MRKEFYPYLLLGLSVIAAWAFESSTVSMCLYAASVVLAFIQKRIKAMGIFSSLLFLGYAYTSFESDLFFYNLTTYHANLLLFALVCLALFRHSLPGFHNYHFWRDHKFDQQSKPFNMFFNLDRPLVALSLLWFGGVGTLRKSEVILFGKQLPLIALWILGVSIVLAALALATSFVRWRPKRPAGTTIWAIRNLVFTCVTEELFFRAFLQTHVHVYVSYWSIPISAVLFGLAHYRGGARYVLLSTVAGFGYAGVFWSTKKVEASILTHFSVNLLHFLLLSYPGLELKLKKRPKTKKGI